MQINNVSANSNQKQPNFKALKGIKFSKELLYNPKAQNELLKVFDHQPVKDIFIKFDGKVEFKAEMVNFARLFPDEYIGNEAPMVHRIACQLVLFNNNLTNLLNKFKEQAKNAGVNIDNELEQYVEKFKATDFELALARYDRPGNYDIKRVLEIKAKYDDAITEANAYIKRIEDGSLVLSEEDPRDVGYWNNTIDHAKERLAELMPEVEFYNENKKDWNNGFYITAKELVSSVLKMNPEKVDKKIPEIVKNKDVIEQDLDNILQDAIYEKNVHNKLKELLGENYIDPKEQDKIDSLKKAGTEINTDLDVLQDIKAKKVVNNGRKTKKSSKKQGVNIAKPVDKLHEEIDASKKLGINIAKPKPVDKQ